jgi:hypothetical protein
MKTGTKVFWGAVVALAIYSIVKSNEPQKASVPLNYNKPVYTTDHAILCPMSLLSDHRADHAISVVMNMCLLSRICGRTPVRGVVQACETGPFPWLYRFESRRIVW